MDEETSPYLVFTSDDSLRAALLLFDRKEIWRRSWCQVRLEREGRTLQALTTEGLDEVLAGELGVPLVRPRRRADGVWVLPSAGGWEEWRKVGERQVEHLLHLLSPRRAKSWQPPATLYIWLQDTNRYRQVARTSLLLGNDRLRVARLVRGGNEEYLLEVQRPSPFLLDKWRAEEGIGLYYLSSASFRLLVPWEYEFPLAPNLLPGRGDREEWWVVTIQGEWFRLQGTGFRNLYELLELDPSVLHWEEGWLLGAVPPFQVRPRLTPAERTPSPCLWMRPAEEREALEELLALTPEPHLIYWLLALAQDQAGRQWYLLWDRSPQGGRLPAPDQGGGYYLDLQDALLFLPAGHRLTPTLSRRLLVGALQLSDDVLTVVDQAEEGGLRLWRIPRSALRPIREAVDYVLVEQVESLRTLSDRIEFAYQEESGPSGDRGACPPARGPWWLDSLRRWGKQWRTRDRRR